VITSDANPLHVRPGRAIGRRQLLHWQSPADQRDRARHRPRRTLTRTRKEENHDLPPASALAPHAARRRSGHAGDLSATPAHAASNAPIASADLDCTITVTTDVHPGVTPQLQHVAVTSHGLTGTADCTGTIDGNAVTGPGTFAVNIQEVADCTQLSGQGEFVLRVPTSSGTQTVAGAFEVTGSSAGTVLTGDLTGTAHVIAPSWKATASPSR
jgi:hypothetical protein